MVSRTKTKVEIRVFNRVPGPELSSVSGFSRARRMPFAEDYES